MHKISDLARWLKQQDDIVILPHIGMDGDSLGSALAMKTILDSLGKRSAICCAEDVPAMYAFLPGLEHIHEPGDLPFPAGALLFVDVADRARVRDRKDWVDSSEVLDWAVLDHHETNPGFCDLNVVDSQAPATGVLVMRLLDELDLPLSGSLPVTLYVAIATDTGNFSFDNTTRESISCLGRLLDAGLDIGTYSRLTFRLRSLPRMKLLGMALQGMQLYAGGKLAVCEISKELFEACGATPPDTEGIVNMLSDIEGVQVGMTVEYRFRDGMDSTKISMRSVGDVDVAAVAKAMGGGGHKNAAGADIKEPTGVVFPQAVDRVLRALKT
jgi:phosphoesterase RecJ-like protein